MKTRHISMADLLQIASLGGTASIWALTQLKVVLGIIIWYSAMLMNASKVAHCCLQCNNQNKKDNKKDNEQTTTKRQQLHPSPLLPTHETLLWDINCTILCIGCNFQCLFPCFTVAQKKTKEQTKKLIQARTKHYQFDCCFYGFYAVNQNT